MKFKILPLFIPHQGCPHQCVFCDQKRITGSPGGISLERITEQVLDFSKKEAPCSRKEVAFYGGSFTALSDPLQRSLLEPAYQALLKGGIDGIRVSTRPDCCGFNALKLLKGYGVNTVELGVQSMDPFVLLSSGRGHGPGDTREALKALKEEGFMRGVQLMPGLPGEDDTSFISTIDSICSLRPDFARIYPTIVIKGTKLEALYKKGEYIPLTIERAVRLCRDGAIRLRNAGIRLIRCGLQTTPSLEREGSVCAGPFHPAFGELVESAILLERITSELFSAQRHLGSRVIIASSPKWFSTLKGQKGENQVRLRRLFPDIEIILHPDLNLHDNLILIKGENGHSIEIPYPIFQDSS